MDKILSREQYNTLISTWRSVEHHDASQHIIYNLLRSKSPDLGFSAIKSPTKINANGNDPWFGYNQARYGIFLITKYLDTFKRLTGLELTDDLIALLKGVTIKREA